MAENIELNNFYSLQKDANTRSSLRDEIIGTVVYSEIDGLMDELSKEDGIGANTECVPELEHALLTYNMNKLKRLMKEGAPYLYEAFNRHRPLELCAFYCRPDITQIILERHVNEGRDCDQESFHQHAKLALFQACISNSVKTVKLLLDADTPILTQVHPHTAAQHGSWGVLSLIYKQEHIDIDERDEHCYTTLHYATKRGYAPTVGYLLACGADPNATCYLDGITPLHLACEYAGEDVLYILVMQGAHLDSVDHSGRTAVLIAASNGKAHAVTILANSGANLDFRDSRGRTPLILAATNGHANVIRELIVNGASLEVTDAERFNALERGILNRRDRASAMIIRLAPISDFLQYFIEKIEIDIHKVIKFGLEKSIIAILDRMIIIDGKCNCTVNTKYLDLDIHHSTPLDEDYNRNAVYLLQRVSELCSDRVAHHGVIRVLVDEKMKQFGYYIFIIKFVFYWIFLLAFGYSLIQAAHEENPFDAYLKDELNYSRIGTEVIVLLYFIANALTEIVEFVRSALSTYRRLKDKRKSEMFDLEREISTYDDQNICEYALVHCGTVSVKSRLLRSLRNTFLLRVFSDYFRERSNYLDILSVLFLAMLIPLRITSQSVQWVFATLAFLLNSLRLFNYINIIPVIGPYSNIFYKILTKDVPKFALMFLIVLSIYSSCFFIALRSPYSIQGIINKTQIDKTKNEIGISNEFIWVLLSGFRIILEAGSVFEANYLFNNLNWLAALVYISFLFLTIVVFLNVFIAQLSDRYAKVRVNAERSFAWHRLNFIIQLQKSSLLSLFIDFRKRFFIEKMQVEPDRCTYYFGTSDVSFYHSMALEEDFDEKSLLSQIKQQIELSIKTKDLTQTMKLMKNAPEEFENFPRQTSLFSRDINKRLRSSEKPLFTPKMDSHELSD